MVLMVSANGLFSQIKAKVFVESNAVLQGVPFKTSVILTGTNSNNNIRINLDGNETDNNADSSVFTIYPVMPGEYVKSMYIQVLDKDVLLYSDSFHIKYIVYPPIAYINSDESNIIYRKIATHMTITVPGIDPKNVMISASMGNVKNLGKGKYVFYVNNVDDRVIVNVTARIGDRFIPMGSKIFRVKSLPEPTVRFETGLDSNNQKLISYLYFSMPGELSYLQLKLDSFQLKWYSSGNCKNYSGNYDKLKQVVNSIGNTLKPGDVLIMENIYFSLISEADKISVTGKCFLIWN